MDSLFISGSWLTGIVWGTACSSAGLGRGRFGTTEEDTRWLDASNIRGRDTGLRMLPPLGPRGGLGEGRIGRGHDVPGLAQASGELDALASQRPQEVVLEVHHLPARVEERASRASGRGEPSHGSNIFWTRFVHRPPTWTAKNCKATAPGKMIPTSTRCSAKRRQCRPLSLKGSHLSAQAPWAPRLGPG